MLRSISRASPICPGRSTMPAGGAPSSSDVRHRSGDCSHLPSRRLSTRVGAAATHISTVAGDAMAGPCICSVAWSIFSWRRDGLRVFRDECGGLFFVEGHPFPDTLSCGHRKCVGCFASFWMIDDSFTDLDLPSPQQSLRKVTRAIWSPPLDPRQAEQCGLIFRWDGGSREGTRHLSRTTIAIP